MRPPIPIPENRISELESFRNKKLSGFEFQRFLCIWLRVIKNMTAVDIAKIIGWNANTVRITQREFIKRGVSVLIGLKRGGRYHANMTPEEEKEFLLSFENSATKGYLPVANEIKEALEKRLGHGVNKTTVYRMLYRNGWRKIVPRPCHPKRKAEAVETFKKGDFMNV